MITGIYKKDRTVTIRLKEDDRGNVLFEYLVQGGPPAGVPSPAVVSKPFNCTTLNLNAECTSV